MASFFNFANWIVTKIKQNNKPNLTVLQCSYYGYSCKFQIAGNDARIIFEFKHHMEKEHGINYPQEAFTQIMYRKSD